jgi:hypothetical protein
MVLRFVLKTRVCFKIRVCPFELSRSELILNIYVLLTVHLDILCNENQLDALLIFNLFRLSTSTCFGRIYCPNSAGSHCICTAIGTRYTFKLTGCWPGLDGTSSTLTRPAASQLKRVRRNNCCTYTVNTC